MMAPMALLATRAGPLGLPELAPAFLSSSFQMAPAGGAGSTSSWPGDGSNRGPMGCEGRGAGT